jgi:two-component system, cell cycle sensor histidine kinase and response regulator CckA
MAVTNKTKAQLLKELAALRRRNAQLAATVAAQRQAAAAVRASEQRYRHLVEQSRGLMCMHTLDGTLLAVNSAAARALGYEPEAWQGRNLREFLAPAVQPFFEAYLARIQHQPTDSGLMRLVTATGEERIWLYHNVRYEEAGTAPYVIGHALDVTERVLAEQALQQAHTNLAVRLLAHTTALQEAEITYRTLVEQARDAILIVQDGHIRYANHACETLSGYSWDEFRQQPPQVGEFLIPEDRARVVGYYARRLRGEAVPDCYEATLMRKDGQRVSVEIKPCIIPYQGQPAIMALLRDITDRKQWEEALLQAKKLESVGVLAGGIAHDFNNILTAILANISLAKRYADPHGKTFGRLTAAENACRRATALTHQLLTFAQGGAPMRRTMAITDLIHDAVDFALRGSNVRGDVILPAQLWPVEIDPDQIHQVLHHVILNAQQAMPQGGVVEVRADNLPSDAALPPLLPPGRWIKITIRDRGCGIPADQLPNIFDPYVTTKARGSGLGLTIAHNIVTKHDGYITVASEVGVGTTVALYLPASASALVSTPARPSLPIVRQETILVMDDDEAIRDVLVDMLTQLGYQSQCVREGAEAIALYQQARDMGQPFVAVLLDLTIPGGMGGRETLAHLQAIDSQVRAIVSSGYATDPLMAHYRAYGFRGVLRKPYTVEGLEEVLQRVLEDRRD